MVPTAAQFRHYQVRFPRASGDGPFEAPIPAIDAEFPPRERGWSLDCKVCMCTGCVSPARAGMVPHLGKEMSVYKGFPRASGDGPNTECGNGLHGWFPPRERGWSRDPTFPRFRLLVSPARAGMVPVSVGQVECLRCFPRASGDGPRDRSTPGSIAQFPPRERGWSPEHDGGGAGAQVSPARAGMVPWATLRTSAAKGFPRASGDGP